MAQGSEIISGCVLSCGLLFVVWMPVENARAASFSVLYAFDGGSDGALPRAGLVRDAAGNLFGTTSAGGANNGGIVFEVAAGGGETVIHAFAGSDGFAPDAGLIMDNAGNLIGTTFLGGADGHGTVFEVAANGTETVLYSFTGRKDGANPLAGVIADGAGNLYGTTFQGGASNLGTVFRLKPNGAEKALYSFTGATDGAYPYAGLVADQMGNLYGTTNEGGDSACSNDGHGCGTVFRLAPDGTETVLHAFTGGSDGAYPSAGLITDKSGNLFGTTLYGGGTGSCGNFTGCGTVFEVAANRTETVLYSFTGANGANPGAELIADKKGDLYGTTSSGGDFGRGAVFKLAQHATETVLHSFKGKDGRFPESSLITDGAGHLYGTAFKGGGHSSGTVFALAK